MENPKYKKGIYLILENLHGVYFEEIPCTIRTLTFCTARVDLKYGKDPNTSVVPLKETVKINVDLQKPLVTLYTGFR